MEQKYFTPALEDFHIGYECEIKPKGSQEFDWMAYRIHENISFQKLLADSIRVPYLTKEQIEAEGWVSKKKGLRREIFIKKLEKSFVYELMYYYDDKGLFITFKFSGGKDQGLFQGMCKDINTLRYISKLLNIQ